MFRQMNKIVKLLIKVISKLKLKKYCHFYIINKKLNFK